MKKDTSIDPTIGSASSITLPHTSGTLNIEEYASTPSNQETTGFPKQTGQSLSYWLQQVRSDPLLDHRTTPTLPRDADTVIIGSGISGTLTAKHHLETWPSKSVVVLEAREFCSGATGRNAGHCKPDQWRGFAKYEKAHGQKQAVKIMENEGETWRALVRYVREEGVQCDLWVGETMDVLLDAGVAEVAKETFRRYGEAGGKVEHINVTNDAAEAVRRTRIKGAQACYAWQASTLQPWKLTAHIMRDNLAKGMNLQTHTLATSITPSTTGPKKWTIHTPRGSISCSTVVHATNAYSAALEASLTHLVTPKPHLCNRVIPPRSFSGSGTLQNSYGVLLPDGGLHSINPRSTSDGNIMFGGTNPGQKALDEWVVKHPEHGTDDGLANVESVTACVREFAEGQFEGWGKGEVGPSEGCRESWSGIVGLSADGVPFVGPLPGKEGQWVCVGHHGHGMARIFTAAPGLVKLMNGQDWSATGLPDVYQMTRERMEKLKKDIADKPNIAVV